MARMLLLVGAAILCSCASVVKVKKGTDEVSGIPFYIKNEHFRQITVYRETWYRLTLKVEKKLVETTNGKEVLLDRGTQSFVAEVKDLNNPALVAIKAALVRADSSNVDDALQLIRDFQAIPARGTATNYLVVKDDVESEWVVDDTNVYYLNARLPWFGNGSLTQKLHPDGTLSEVIGTADTKLSEGISALIPLKEYLTGEFIEPAPAASTDPTKAADIQKGANLFFLQGGSRSLTTKQYVYFISLNTDEIGHEVTLRSTPSQTRPPLTAVLALGAPGVSMSRKPLPVKEEPPKDDAPMIGISGSIKLPKEK